MTTDPEKLSCDHCTAFEVPKLSKAGPHIKAECSVCGRYIKFLPKWQENRYADQKAIKQQPLFKPSEVYDKVLKRQKKK